MSRKRIKATSFERIDFIIEQEEALGRSAPPATPRTPAPPAGPTVTGPVEVSLPRRLDVHRTGRVDTQFARHQRMQPIIVIVVVLVFLTVVGLSTIAAIGVIMALWLG